MLFIRFFVWFMLYGFLGWCYETLIYTLQEKKFINTGFLFGPFCPIYGGAAVGMVFLFYSYAEHPMLVFILGMAFATIFEYISAVILENIFHLKWWDYSKIKFNYKGRVCLLGALAFGTLCVLLVEFLHPTVEYLTGLVPENALLLIAGINAVILFIDILATCLVLYIKRKKNSNINEIKNRQQMENELPTLDISVVTNFSSNIREKITTNSSVLISKIKDWNNDNKK